MATISEFKRCPFIIRRTIYTPSDQEAGAASSTSLRQTKTIITIEEARPPRQWIENLSPQQGKGIGRRRTCSPTVDHAQISHRVSWKWSWRWMNHADPSSGRAQLMKLCVSNPDALPFYGLTQTDTRHQWLRADQRDTTAPPRIVADEKSCKPSKAERAGGAVCRVNQI